MLCSTSLPRLLFWGSVNTGFRHGLLSIVGTTGHASIKMLNVSIRSICLQREENRRFPVFFFPFLAFSPLVDSLILQIYILFLLHRNTYSSYWLGRKKKKNTSLIRSLQSVTTNFCLLSYLVGAGERDSARRRARLSCNIEL